MDYLKIILLAVLMALGGCNESKNAEALKSFSEMCQDDMSMTLTIGSLFLSSLSATCIVSLEKDKGKDDG